MPRSVLVLGGTDFVGPALIDAALARGDAVTVFNRGRTGPVPDGAEHVVGDRADPASLSALQDRRWDLVVDAWSSAPSVVRDSATALAGIAARYVYISTVSVYAAENFDGVDEGAPTVAADPDAGATDYAADKRGAEIAVERAVGPDRILLARPGLILGPRENIGRLPWWLARMARGGEVLAPGPEANPLQYVDARDLAAFALDTSLTGPVNVLSRPGQATMSELLGACIDVTGGTARLEWVDAAFLLAAGVRPWSELPIWMPPAGETEGFYRVDSRRALGAGLDCRPAGETVAATWAWLRDHPSSRTDRAARGGPVGMAPDRERELLDAWRAQPPAAL